MKMRFHHPKTNCVVIGYSPWAQGLKGVTRQQQAIASDCQGAVASVLCV
jgi:hypothetical protein